MTTTTTEPVSLKISRFLKAPPQRVFAAWTTANELAQWLGGGPRKVIAASIDLRVGGEYRLDTISEEHGEAHFAGEYREVKPPERLVFTWTGACVPELKGVQTLVTVELTEEKGGTRLQLTHEGFPSAEIRDRHTQGWTTSFDNLEKLV